MRAIGSTQGIGAPLSPNRVGGDKFIRYIGDRLILDFHEGAGTTVRDLSGNGNNGTLTSPTNLTWELRRLKFGGVSGYVNCTHDLSLNLESAWTIQAQVKADAVVPHQGIITKWLDPSKDFAFIVLASGELYLLHNIANVEKLVGSTATIDDSTQHHLVGVNDGTDLRVYIESVLAGTGVEQGGTTDNDGANLCIGFWRPATNEYFKGLISFIRINATAFSAPQVLQEYLFNLWRN